MDFATILTLVWSTLLQFAQLAGVAALLAAIVNVVKYFGAIPDGQAGSWFAGLDLVAMAVLVGFRLFAPDVSLTFLDSQAAVLAQILLFVLGYVMSLKVGSGTATTLADMEIPVVGASATRGTLKADAG